MDANGTMEALWRAQAQKALKGAPFDSLSSHTLDGIEIRPLYPRAAGGPFALRQRPERPWGIVQRVDHPDPVRANELALADLVGGANVLALVFAGAPSAYGFGIAAADLARVLDGVELDLIAFRLDLAPGDEAAAVEAVIQAVAGARLVPGSLDIDFGLGAGEEASGLLRRLREAGYASPMLRADGRAHHDAGASEAQELAAVVASGLALLRRLEAEGWPLDEARRLISFELCVDADQFMGLAKLRALRRLWAGVETICGLEPRPIRLAAQTSYRMASRLDPAVNWLRATSALFAAGTGGADQITILPHTIALGLPDAFSRRMARNEQIVLIEESHLAKVGDPAAGSGAVEALTDALLREAWDLVRRIEGEGGLAAMKAAGTWQALVSQAAEARARRIRDGEAPLVGTTLFRDESSVSTPVLAPAPAGGLADIRRDAQPFEGLGR